MGPESGWISEKFEWVGVKKLQKNSEITHTGSTAPRLPYAPLKILLHWGSSTTMCGRLRCHGWEQLTSGWDKSVPSCWTSVGLSCILMFPAALCSPGGLCLAFRRLLETGGRWWWWGGAWKGGAWVAWCACRLHGPSALVCVCLVGGHQVSRGTQAQLCDKVQKCKCSIK